MILGQLVATVGTSDCGNKFRFLFSIRITCKLIEVSYRDFILATFLVFLYIFCIYIVYKKEIKKIYIYMYVCVRACV